MFPLSLLPLASALDLQLPEGTNIEPISGSTVGVEVDAEGWIHHDGRTWAASAPILPTLAEPLGTWHTANPSGVLVFAVDRSAPFRSVRAALATAYDTGFRWFSFLTADGSVIRFMEDRAPDTPDTLVPLVVHLRVGSTWIGREADRGVRLPTVGGHADLAGIAAMLTEDHRLHPSATLVVLNTDDDVPFGETFAILDATRTAGYPRTLLAGAPPERLEPESPPGPAPAKLVRPTRVRLQPDGRVEYGLADGASRTLDSLDIAAFEAHCDETTCDVLALTATERVLLGAGPRAAFAWGWLFARPLTMSGRRLPGAPVPVEGRFSPLVQTAPADVPELARGGGASVVSGDADVGWIERQIEVHEVNARHCYGWLLDRHPAAAGTVTLRFAIERGLAQSVTIASADIADEQFQRCLIDYYSRLEVPAADGTIVTYAFVFGVGVRH